MKTLMLVLLCTVFMSISYAPAKAQHSDHSQYSDPRTPQGTLRAFAAALTQADLAHPDEATVSIGEMPHLPGRSSKGQ